MSSLFALVHIKMGQLKDVIQKHALIDESRKEIVSQLFEDMSKSLLKSVYHIEQHEKYVDLNDEILKDRFLINNELKNLPQVSSLDCTICFEPIDKFSRCQPINNCNHDAFHETCLD